MTDQATNSNLLAQDSPILPHNELKAASIDNIFTNGKLTEEEKTNMIQLLCNRIEFHDISLLSNVLNQQFYSSIINNIGDLTTEPQLALLKLLEIIVEFGFRKTIEYEKANTMKQFKNGFILEFNSYHRYDHERNIIFSDLKPSPNDIIPPYPEVLNALAKLANYRINNLDINDEDQIALNLRFMSHEYLYELQKTDNTEILEQLITHRNFISAQIKGISICDSPEAENTEYLVSGFRNYRQVQTQFKKLYNEQTEEEGQNEEIEAHLFRSKNMRDNLNEIAVIVKKKIQSVDIDPESLHLMNRH
ncbi:MAG: hypothetical protein EZS28_011868 [Streblomastix strix]|uniref:Uncharacterized protein n=1 Tax=Streblomastix strix TaxID=222440 RepID=A0A5J4WCE0_9EUKA|nr:MAG: hypothetical protein EZS28_011868 [Streblomastix strix]